MSRWLDLVRKAVENANASPDTPTKGDKSPGSGGNTPFCRVLSGCRAEGSEKYLTPQPCAGLPDGDVSSPYGESLNENPKTWTGKVVSLDEWRRLSEWEKHDSTGKMWNGLTRQWEPTP